ncbi:uncharacterized protein LOC110844445 [Folsomia candida]|uniref:O-acyltransferase WSD n=1 Tax=Folsomia candida TaxID=158441 RepID=A0A226ET81_FOLCA|nr:uncharacterized protein LOC110844445 [Folsomia candida]OXA60822.1 O-acyltransferase WSD [Folsomia candida]
MGKISTPSKTNHKSISEMRKIDKALLKLSKILSKLGKLVLIVLSFFGYVFILIPFFIVLMSPLYMYRFVVIFLAKVFRSDLVRIVCTRDGVVGLDDVTKKCQCVLNIMLTYRGEPDMEKIRNIIQTNVIDVIDKDGKSVYEKFTQYYEPWLGYSFWKNEDKFNIKNHIRLCEEAEIILAGNNNNNNNNNNNESEKKFITEEELLKIMGPISTRHFPQGISPWEILIVRNFIPSQGKIHSDFEPNIKIDGGDEKDKFAMIFRVHHALSDGYSIMKLFLTRVCNVDPNDVIQPFVPKMSMIDTVKMYLGIILLSPYYHLKQFVIDVDRNFWHVREKQLTKDWYTIRSEKVAMSDLRKLAKFQNVTTTAVLLAGFGSGIKTFLTETGQGGRIPSVMRALAPMPWKNHPMHGLVNHWTLGLVVLPVGAVNKFRVAEKSIQLLKRSPILFTNFGTVPLLMGPPSWLTDIWATNWMTTMILSNFPGPKFPMKSFGNNYVEDVTFWLPQMRGSSSAGVSFVSYNGGMRIAATLDKKIVPTQKQTELLSHCINQELRNLMDVALSGENVV